MELSNLNQPLHQDVQAESDARCCHTCGKKVSIVAAAMPCRCQRIFCDAHRFPEEHECSAIGSAPPQDRRALVAECQARDIATAVPRTTVPRVDYRQAFSESHDMTSRIAHVASFLVFFLFFIISIFQLFNLKSTLWWILIGAIAAVATAKLGPKLQDANHPPCCSCVYSRQAWCGGPGWRVVRDVEYESAMEVLIYICTYRGTNCMTDTLYSGPREFGFIMRTVSAKVASLAGSGAASNILSGCRAPGAA